MSASRNHGVKRKNPFLAFIALSIFCGPPIFKGTWAGLSEERKTFEEGIQIKDSGLLQEYPDFVRAVRPIAKRIDNTDGFWEAEFDHGISMIYIPPGEFQAGSDKDNRNGPSMQAVNLDGYWIGKYEVTFEQYDLYCEEQGMKKPDDEGWGRDKYPVINISWLEATAYCRWLSRKSGGNFKLPTEAQWEKAARGTDGRLYPWGNSLPSTSKANYGETDTIWAGHARPDQKRPKKTVPVGSHPQGASPYGALDMAGNVYEWCRDWYSPSRLLNPLEKNPQGPRKGSYRVLRGGSWFSGSQCLRTDFRISAKPRSRYFHIGFRLCLD